MTYLFDRFSVSLPLGAKIEDVVTPDDNGPCVLADEAIRREARNAERIKTLVEKLASARAVGSNTDRVNATELFAKLRKLADEAWPQGPLRAERNLNWAYPQTQVEGDGHYGPKVIMRFVRGTPNFSCTIGKAEYEWRNADFFAAASPEVVLFLLDHIEYLGAKLEQAVRQESEARAS